MSVFSELKRRNVFRVAGTYLVTSWLLIEVSATLEDTLHLPEWADSLLAMFLLLGFPVAIFVSWAYEMTPEGLKKERDLAPDGPARHATGRKLDRLLIVMMALALGYFALDKFVFEDGSQPAAPAATVTQSSAGETPEPVVDAAETPDLSIAVLPFVNMSSDPEQEYFSDGLTEELLNLLAGVEPLRVAARTSSFYYKDKLSEIPFGEIGRQLGVAHLLEGSVRKSGDRIRITAQLIKAEDGFHLWSNTWDRTLDDIFAIQDEIAAAVTEELKITLLGAAPTSRVIDPGSYELALEGRFLYGRRAPGDLERALKLFEQAVLRDPANAIAWIGAAPLYLRQYDPPRIDDALHATARAVELAPGNPEAWSRRALALWMAERSAEAERAWEKAVELGQDNPLIQSQIAGLYAARGDLAGAVAALRRALELDPLYPTNIANLASYLTMAGRLSEARELAEKLRRLVPNTPGAFTLLATIELLEGRPQLARDLIDQRLPANTGDHMQPDSDAWWDALIEHALGNDEAADAALQTLIAEEADRRPVSIACLYAWRGQPDEAFAWLHRALDENPRLILQWSLEPWLNSLEDDPRWAELMVRWTSLAEAADS